MYHHQQQQQQNAIAVAACVAALAGLALWSRSRRQQLLKSGRPPQCTNHLRFDLSVAEIAAETKRILSHMKRVDDEIAALAPADVTFANTAQRLIDLDHELMSRVTNVTFLGQVAGDKVTRDACTKAEEAIEDFSVLRSMQAGVFRAVNVLYKSAEYQVSR